MNIGASDRLVSAYKKRRSRWGVDESRGASAECGLRDGNWIDSFSTQIDAK
jgi:hypothetical protein